MLLLTHPSTFINKHMNFNNIKLLIRRYFLKDGFNVIIGMTSIWLLIIIINSLKDQAVSAIDLDFYYTAMTMLLIIGGPILASLMFFETSESSKGYQFAILPVSIADKLFSAWFISSILYGLLFAMYYYFGLIIFEILKKMGVNSKAISYSFMPNEMIQIYFLTNAFCLMGASWFKKNPVVMNMVFSTIVSILFIGSLGIIFYFIKPSGMVSSFTDAGTMLSINDNITRFTISNSADSMLLVALLTGFFMLVAFYKLKERSI